MNTAEGIKQTGIALQSIGTSVETCLTNGSCLGHFVIATIIAFIPIFAWLFFFFRKAEEKKSLIGIIFFLGILTVVPLIMLQATWRGFPSLDVRTAVPGAFHNHYIAETIITVFLAMTEEIFKQWLLRIADKKWLIVKSVSDSIRFSMVAAMGFSFAENIYPYFFSVISSGNYGELMGAFFFRSLFTTALHMVASGIFGYYYGIGKFSANYRDQTKWEGEKMYFAKAVCWIFQIPQDLAYREQKIFQGLLVAMALHGGYNTILQFSSSMKPLMIGSIFIVVIGFAYLMILLSRKQIDINMVTDLSTHQESSMAKKDEDVVMELMGQWFNEGKYTDVINMCNRLLQRDPDNELVKLFKNKTEDTLKGSDLYHEATEIVGTRKQVEDKSIMEKLEQQKQQQNKETLPKNFQESEEYKKFLEEEKKKKQSGTTYQLDIPSGGPLI